MHIAYTRILPSPPLPYGVRWQIPPDTPFAERTLCWGRGISPIPLNTEGIRCKGDSPLTPLSAEVGLCWDSRGTTPTLSSTAGGVRCEGNYPPTTPSAYGGLCWDSKGTTPTRSTAGGVRCVAISPPTPLSAEVGLCWDPRGTPPTLSTSRGVRCEGNNNLVQGMRNSTLRIIMFAYILCIPALFSPSPSHIFVSDGDGGNHEPWSRAIFPQPRNHGTAFVLLSLQRALFENP